MLARAEKAQVDAEELARIVEAARTEVVAAFDAVRERQVSAETEKLSIESIGDATDGRLRLDTLPENGYFTVADVLRAGPEQLAHVSGIGEGEAAKVAGAADQVRQAVRDSLQFRIDLDPSDGETTRMLQALAVWGAVRHAGETYETQAAQLARELTAHRPQAEAAGAGNVRRLFMAAGRKEAADGAAQRVRALLDNAG
ncbi:MAG: hypothetical protein QOH91_2482, partial [Mycobacterium sp.]|nr:hypothetical protein [Mycobacterium sp.]